MVLFPGLAFRAFTERVGHGQSKPIILAMDPHKDKGHNSSHMAKILRDWLVIKEREYMNRAHSGAIWDAIPKKDAAPTYKV